MIAAASPPRIAAPSWSESNSATPLGASDFRVVTKKSAAALPLAELKIGFHLSSKKSAPNDRKTGKNEVTIGLPFTPRKTKPYLILPLAIAARPPLTRASHVAGAVGKMSFL